MQETNHSFTELKTELLEKLRNRGCTTITITGYRYLCNSIFTWLSDNGFDCYTEKAGFLFLQHYQSEHGENQYYLSLHTVVQRLNDLLKGKWSDVHSDKGKHFCLPDAFAEIVDRYCNWSENTGHAYGTIRNKRYAISWFLGEISKQDCKSLDALSPSCVARASLKVTNYSLWGEIRQFLTYLTEFEGVTSDYSTIVPHYGKPYIIPSIYSVEEIKRIEEAIDTSTVVGKRNYAMILLASRMGMRSGDIVRLTIEDVLNRTDLDIIQTKTGNVLHLPLISVVKSAIDDYLSVRPESQTDIVFINAYAPYNPVTTSTIRAALRKYIGLAGIDSGNRKRGPHALRASLASSMVNNDISYETVRKVLGHSSNSAIKHYARIDIDNLRKYSLTPPPPSNRFFAFCTGRWNKMAAFNSVFCEEILMYLSVREAELSHEAYRHCRRTMILFDDYLCRINHVDKEMPEPVIESWIREVSKGISVNTSSQHVHYIRRLLLFLTDLGYTCFIPRTLTIHDTYVPYLYSDEDIEKIFVAADSLKISRARKNKFAEKEMPLILRLLFCCGLRVGETVCIKVGDLDFERNLIILRVTKKYKQRMVPFGKDLAEIIYRYCIGMGILNDSDAYLFPADDTKSHISPGNVGNYFRIIRKKAGITCNDQAEHGRGACLHCFRHSFAVRSFDKNERSGIKASESVPFLSTYLGHDSLYETEKYLKYSGTYFEDTLKKFDDYSGDLFPEVIIYE